MHTFLCRACALQSQQFQFQSQESGFSPHQAKTKKNATQILQHNMYKKKNALVSEMKIAAEILRQ